MPSAFPAVSPRMPREVDAGGGVCWGAQVKTAPEGAGNTDEGLPPATGQSYVLPGGAFFDIRDDRIARVTNYYNLQDWIAQVSR